MQKKMKTLESDGGKGGSDMWRRMQTIKMETTAQMGWILGKGEISFWQDQWIHGAILIDIVQPPPEIAKVTVREVLTNERDLLGKCKVLLPNHLSGKINEMSCCLASEEDRCIWMANADGKFSLASAWNIGRQKSNFLTLNNCVWSKYISSKWSIVVWRALRSKLPLDDALQKVGIQLVSKCVCCIQPKRESVSHVFVTNEIARVVWRHFEGVFGIFSSGQLLQQKLSSWWIHKAKSPCIKEILSFVPVCICWEMWRNRCRGKADERLWPADMIIACVGRAVRAVFDGSTVIASARVDELDMCRAVGLNVGSALKQACIITRWVWPESNKYKLNADGCSRGNPGDSGGGSLLRDHSGHVLWAVSDFYGHNTNMVAEARALLQGLQKCIEEGFFDVEAEIDSLILVKIVNREVEVPWRIVYEVREIWKLVSQMQFKLSHTYRENNQSADFLANYGCSHQCRQVFHGFGELPHSLRGIVNVDRLGLANLRIKKL